MTTFIFAQQGKTTNSIPPPTAADILSCLQSSGGLPTCGTPPIIPYNPVLLRGAAAPSQSASDFVNYFAAAYSATLGASSQDAGQILSLSQKKIPYQNLAVFLKANPKSAIAAAVQQLNNSGGTYDAFQSGLSQLYSSLSNQTEKDFVYSLSNALEILNQSASAGLTGKAAGNGCSGWWSCWGHCAASILGGALGSGLSGAIGGSAVPGLGTVAGGIIGAVGGAITGAVAGCS